MKNKILISLSLISTLLSANLFAKHHHHHNNPFPPSNGFSSSFHQEYQWVKARSNHYSSDAIIGGGEPGRAEPFYICRARYNNGVHPGKVVDGRCNIAWGGEEIVLPRYELLLGNNRNIKWQPAKNGFAPRNAVAGGFEEGHPLYICQALYHNGMHPGKIVKNSCNIAWGGKEILVSRYNVLVG